MSVTQSPIKMIHNGDLVIGMTNKKTVQSMAGYFDTTTLSSFYEQDPDKYNLGLIKLWGQQAKTSYPIYQALMEKKAMLNVSGADGSFSYDIAIKDSGKCMTIRDYSTSYPNAGLDGSNFRIALNKRYAPGVKLTVDLMYGEHQLIVTDEEPIRQIPGGWDMPVKLTDADRNASYDTSLLVSGIQYFQVGHSIFGEYGTNYENFDLMDTPTTMRCMFQLGNMSGAESYMTGRASMKFSGADASLKAKDYINELEAEANSMGEFSFITEATNVGKTAEGKVTFKKGGLHLGHTIQMLLHKKHQKSVATELLFQKAGTVQGTNGITKLNEGIFHQIRRGKLIQYGRPMGITRAHIMEAVQYIFRVSDLAEELRFVEFSVGTYAKQNMYEIFKDEINAQAPQIERWLGSDALIKNVVTGSDNLNLAFNPVRFVEAYLQGIGKVRIKHDPALDHYPGADRFQSGMHQGGLAHTAYSMVVWDVADQKYSNNNTLPQGASLVEGGDAGANMYIVKPTDGMTWFGGENGRFSSMTNSNIVSSSKYQTEGYWIFSIVAAWVKDLSRYVIIELDPSYRNGLN